MVEHDCRDLPAAWQQEALPNDPIGTNWVYWEALVVSSSPVFQLTRDNLDPESGEAPQSLVYRLHCLAACRCPCSKASPTARCYSMPGTTLTQGM